ncbi:MAG: phosphate ABC transporter substrate-binding protein PstS family protein [Ktedonobacteraceae bacterium]
MSKQWRVALVLAVAMAISLFISACSSDTGTVSGTSTAATNGACQTGSISASGSTALAPLVEAVAKDYQARCSGSSITVNLGGSKTGLSQVEAGSVQIGDSDIFASSSQSDLVDHQVAVVIFTLIINSKVTGITNLTTDQIKGIYSGQTTNWKQVGGNDLKIVVVSRPPSSGTRATFQKYILGGPETISGPSNLTSDSTGVVVQNVKQTDGAIGYAASAAARSSGLTIIKIDGNDASADSVKNNTYKFWNIEHMYTKGQAAGLAKSLIDFMASDQGKQEAAKLNFILVTDMSSDALKAHQPAS